MKRTTYYLIALIAFLFVGAFILYFIMSRTGKSESSEIQVYVTGKTSSHRLPVFSKIVLEDNGVPFSIYHIKVEEKTYAPLYHIIISDTVTAPEIKLSDDWGKMVSYEVEDSVLTIMFAPEAEKITASDITVITPVLNTVDINTEIGVEIAGSMADTLFIDAYSDIYLGRLEAEQVNVIFDNVYRHTFVDAGNAKIEKLHLTDADDITLWCNKNIGDILIYPPAGADVCNIDLQGKPSGTIEIGSWNGYRPRLSLSSNDVESLIIK